MTKHVMAIALLLGLTGCKASEEDRPLAIVEDSAAEATADTTVNETSVDSALEDTGGDDSGADTSSADSIATETAADSSVLDSKATDSALAVETSIDSSVADSPAVDSAVDSAADSAVVETSADTTPPDTSAACVDLAAPTCNALAMPAAATFVTTTMGTIPTFTRGGAFPDGTYVLVKQIKSSGTIATAKDAFQYVGGCLQDYSIKSDSTEIRANAKIVVDATTGAQSFTFTCPTAGALPAGSAYGTEVAAGGKVKLITLDFTGTDYREWMQQ